MVDSARFGTDELKELVADMKETMVKEDGIGIAAPQIDIHDRVVIVSLKDEGAVELVNPKIVSRSFSTAMYEEGCLSVPGTFGMVKRHKKIKVKAYDAEGNMTTRSLKGMDAVVVQHEIDHLDGVLFIDKVERYTHEPAV